MASTHRCFQCEAKAAEIVALRENWAAAKRHAENLVLKMDAKDAEIADLQRRLELATDLAGIHRDGHERQMRLMAELSQAGIWSEAAGDMVD